MVCLTRGWWCASYDVQMNHLCSSEPKTVYRKTLSNTSNKQDSIQHIQLVLDYFNFLELSHSILFVASDILEKVISWQLL